MRQPSAATFYYDPIRDYREWKIQTRQRQTTDAPEETSYSFKGATANGLLVVIAGYNGGGTGTFHTLHILDVTAAIGFDSDGKRYQRINLTDVRSIVLGDRWEGEMKISGNAVRATTRRNGPANLEPRSPMTITAERP